MQCGHEACKAHTCSYAQLHVSWISLIYNQVIQEFKERLKVTITTRWIELKLDNTEDVKIISLSLFIILSPSSNNTNLASYNRFPQL